METAACTCCSYILHYFFAYDYLCRLTSGDKETLLTTATLYDTSFSHMNRAPVHMITTAHSTIQYDAYDTERCGLVGCTCIRTSRRPPHVACVCVCVRVARCVCVRLCFPGSGVPLAFPPYRNAGLSNLVCALNTAPLPSF